MISMLALLAAAGTAVSNTTTETSLHKLSLPAGALTPGKVLEGEVSVRVTAQNSTDTVQLKVRFGSDATVPGSNTSCAANTAVDAAVSDVATVKWRLHCQSETRAVLTVEMPDCDAEGTTSMESYQEILTIAQATAYYLDVTATWSVANAGNSVQAEAAFAREQV